MWITGKRALVTGGTGSFGQFIVRRLLDLGATEIRIMSRDEKKHYDMRHHYANEPRAATDNLSKWWDPSVSEKSR